MRLKLLLPPVRPDIFSEPTGCPYKGCEGKHFNLRQESHKPLRDTLVSAVVARRYECLRCHRTFRIYPTGVSHAQSSARLKGLGILLYVLGLSYGAVALTLEALGHPLGKTAVYQAVQSAGEKVPGLRRDAVALPRGKSRVVALGVDLTSVKCKGTWISLGVSVDAQEGIALTVDILDNAEAQTLKNWVGEVAAAVGAEVLVSDDADGFKKAADDGGLEQQVCKSHVRRNTEEWVERMKPELARDADGSLKAIGVKPEQAVADCDELLRLVRERPAGAQSEALLEAIHRRYIGARPPNRLGEVAEKASLAYRMRLFSLDRWNLWPRLTLYRCWQDENGGRLDGTNNATERAIVDFVRKLTQFTP
jgi:transposase-like protein